MAEHGIELSSPKSCMEHPSTPGLGEAGETALAQIAAIQSTPLTKLLCLEPGGSCTQ